MNIVKNIKVMISEEINRRILNLLTFKTPNFIKNKIYKI